MLPKVVQNCFRLPALSCTCSFKVIIIDFARETANAIVCTMTTSQVLGISRKSREGRGAGRSGRVSSHTNACKKSKKVVLPFFPLEIPKFSYFQIVDLGLWACLRFLNRLKVVIVHFYTSRGNRFLYSDSYAPSSEFKTKGTEVSVPSLAEKITFEPPYSLSVCIWP